mmetsp:Transcript_9228/g.17015  ORF Transcript_9228/g.17015 Transcript_9228/m.17015 type:complete len:168 (-) Transcript_9228:129-632(-)
MWKFFLVFLLAITGARARCAFNPACFKYWTLAFCPGVVCTSTMAMPRLAGSGPSVTVTMFPLPMANGAFPLDPCARPTLHASGRGGAKRSPSVKLLNGVELPTGPQVKGQAGASPGGPLSRQATAPRDPHLSRQLAILQNRHLRHQATVPLNRHLLRQVTAPLKHHL